MLLAEISGTTALLSTAFVLACAVTFIAFVVGAALLLRNSSRRTGPERSMAFAMSSNETFMVTISANFRRCFA